MCKFCDRSKKGRLSHLRTQRNQVEHGFVDAIAERTVIPRDDESGRLPLGFHVTATTKSYKLGLLRVRVDVGAGCRS